MAAAGNTGDLKVTVGPAELSERSPEHNSACLVAGGVMRCSEKWRGGSPDLKWGSRWTRCWGVVARWRPETLEELSGHCAKLLQSCLTLCDPTDCIPPGSSVHGIFQARILEWVAFPSPGDLPDPGIKPRSLTSPALASGLFGHSHQLGNLYLDTSMSQEEQLASSNLALTWLV